jgi:hypothetical protein
MFRTDLRRQRRWVLLLAVLAMIASACGGEVTDDAGDSNGDDTPATTVTSAPDDGASDDGNSDGGTTGNTYEDPRGGIFADFQASFDRGDHPFQQLDQYCVSHEAASDRVATDPGIEADSIKIVHIRSRLEDAIDIGFGIPVGDPADMFEVFVDYVNTQCGGVRGRMIDLHMIEVPLFGPTVETDRNAACVEAIEDENAVIIVNSSGFQGSATLCITEEHDTLFISTQGQTDEFMERSNNNLFTMSLTFDEALRLSAEHLLTTGAVKAGDSFGVAAMDTPGQPEAVQSGLVDPLEAAGVNVVFDVLTCNGSTICTEGVTESVSNMRDAGITHFFNVMGILTAPGYIDEMVNQGFKPGDVSFHASDFNSQASELVSGQITANSDSGALYAGAEILDFRGTGDYRSEGYAPSPLQELCTGVYNANNTIGATHVWQDQGGDSAFGMATSVCSIMRIALRSLYDAGDNPTRADVKAAMNNLGPVDMSSQTPASIREGKGQTPDVYQILNFDFPCEQTYPYVMNSGNAVCITGTGNFTLIDR